MDQKEFSMNDKQAGRILKEMEEMFGELPDPEVYPMQFMHKCKLFHYYKNRKKVNVPAVVTESK
jgi:vacuolar-type H+-ATPase catalytic subunit A/Vma1